MGLEMVLGLGSGKGLAIWLEEAWVLSTTAEIKLRPSGTFGIEKKNKRRRILIENFPTLTLLETLERFDSRRFDSPRQSTRIKINSILTEICLIVNANSNIRFQLNSDYFLFSRHV